MTQNFIGMNSKHFNIYRDEKSILAYNLIFLKCHVGLDSTKLDRRLSKEEEFGLHY